MTSKRLKEILAANPVAQARKMLEDANPTILIQRMLEDLDIDLDAPIIKRPPDLTDLPAIAPQPSEADLTSERPQVTNKGKRPRQKRAEIAKLIAAGTPANSNSIWQKILDVCGMPGSFFREIDDSGPVTVVRCKDANGNFSELKQKDLGAILNRLKKQ